MKYASNFLSKALVLGALLLSNSVHAEFAVRLQNGFRQYRSDFQIAHLDSGTYENLAGPTNSWSSLKAVNAYEVGAYGIWKDPCSHLFASVHGRYGWLLSGTAVGYPLHWNIDGHTSSVAVRGGYIFDICGCFEFAPLIGYKYGIFHTKIKGQNYAHTSPVVFISRNGNKNQFNAYTPLIGFDVFFTHCFCNNYNVDFFLGYDFRYGRGTGRLTVPEFIVTDNAATSNYGYHVKQTVAGHDIRLGGRYAFCNGWDIGLGIEYNVLYNVCSKRVKLQHNQEIVDTGQFTESQYHVVNHSSSNSYGIDFSLGYTF